MATQAQARTHTNTRSGARRFGPIELVALSFPENRFSGEIVDELERLVDSDVIRIIDVIFVKKDASGEIDVMELSELEDDDYASFSIVVADDLSNFLNEDDAREISRKMKNGSSAAIMLFENRWAMEFVEAVERAHGEVVMNERIPRETVKELVRMTRES